MRRPVNLSYVSLGPTHQVVAVSRISTVFTFSGDNYACMGF